MIQIAGRDDRSRMLWQSAVTGIGFFLLGYGGITLTGHGRMIALIWPANAFAVCMMVRLSRSRLQDILMLAAVLVAEVAINLAVRAPTPVTIGFSIVSLAEVTGAVWAVRRFGRFRDVPKGLLFLAAAIVTPALIGAGLAASVMIAVDNPDWLADSRHWFAANVLGFCILLPVGLAISRRKLTKLKLHERRLEAVLVFAGLLLASLIAIRWQARPMPVMILPIALAAAVRFRHLGAGLAMLVILIVMMTSDLGVGTSPDYIARIEMFQIFLAVTSLIGTRAAMLLNERDLHLAMIEGRRRSAIRASRFKSQLLSHVGKEARGPLAAIIGISTVLESGRLSPDRAQEFAHVVAHNGELLQRLYADLLDLSQTDTRALIIQREKVHLGQTLKTCIGAIRLEAALGGKSVLLGEVDEDLNVHADPKRLAQIVSHLIANSYKYGDNDSPIRVRASRLADGFGRIEIMNTGPGITLRERDAMFSPFGPESGGRTVPGAGLGLSMARLLAEKQGGRVDFESIPGRQTRFWLDLPLAA
ncbi:MAG: MASE1 domain-containing protein [Alphaproteobacteria bacterium]|nr:MASE1 domain-containing protein [Alphaproteobacteria bacterium]